jgi:hypothetical protein
LGVYKKFLNYVLYGLKRRKLRRKKEIMYWLRNKRKFLQVLLLVLLPAPFVWAAPNKKDKADNNTKVAIDFRFGVPGKWIISQKKSDYTSRQTKPEISASPNIDLGIVVTHSFDLGNEFKLGPAIGMFYAFPRKLQIISFSSSFSEKYLQIPIAIQCNFPGKEGIFIRQDLSLGYEVIVLLSSHYKKKQEIDLTQEPEFPRLSGSIFLGSMGSFSNGIYIAARAKLPIELFMSSRSDYYNLYGEKPNKEDIHNLRRLAATAFELSIGVDIMKWV